MDNKEDNVINVAFNEEQQNNQQNNNMEVTQDKGSTSNSSEPQNENNSNEKKVVQLKIVEGKKKPVNKKKPANKKPTDKKTTGKKPADKKTTTPKPTGNRQSSKRPVSTKVKTRKAPRKKKMMALIPDRKATRAFIDKNRTSLFFIVVALLFIIISIIINNTNIISIGEKQVMFSKEYSISSKADFYVRNKNIFYVSKDGMMFLDNKGDTVWSDTFTMSAPYMLTEGNYVAVADANNKTVKVYDTSGKIYEVAVQGPITTFAINEIGCCAVVCQNNADYTVDVFSNTGDKMFECSRAAKDGTPVGVDISDDGSILGLTVANYNELKLNSNILFYYTSKENAQTTESSDGLVSAVNIEDSLASIIRFDSSNRCIVASDSALMAINCTGKEFKTLWTKEFENHVTAFGIDKNNSIAVAYGEPVDMTNSDATARQNTVSWYNTNGKEIGVARSDERIDNIFTSDRGTIVASGKDFTAYTDRGHEIWKYSAVQNIKSMQFYNNDNSVVIVTPTHMQLIDVKKGVTMQEETTEYSQEGATESSKEATTSAEKATQVTTKAE